MIHVKIPHEWNTLVRSKTGVADSCNEVIDDAGIIEGPKRHWTDSAHAKSGTRQKRKKMSFSVMSTDDGNSSNTDTLTNETGNISSANDVCESILRGINHTPRVKVNTDASFSQLDVDHVLSRLPYKQMIQDLFGSTEQSGMISNVPIVSRLYEVSCFPPHLHPGAAPP